MAYVPYQHWDKTYSLCKGLQAGTIFPELDKPFCGKGGKCR
ncbi:MAG: spore coat associated protein CotJA [Eubacteriales bacterium]|nr:spore coat associated protein CotJA [Eubacteriales bacterium]